MGDLGLAVTGGLREMLEDPAGRQRIEQALPTYLAKQRWFGGKAREVREVRFEGWVPLDAGAATVLGLVAVVDIQEVRTEHPVCLTAGAGGALVEGLGHEPATRRLLAAVRRGRVEGHALALVGSEQDGAEPGYVRPMDAEQSNSSVVCDEREVVKLYRRVGWGPNPEIEMTSALAAAGFKEMPALSGAAWLERADGDRAGLALIQEFKPEAKDCWTVALDSLQAAERRGAEDVLQLLEAIGRTTGRMHLALASIDRGGFTAERATPEDVRTWVAETRHEAAVASRVDAAALGEGVREALERCGELDVWSGVGDAGLRIRVHGDYHLGQVLQSDGALYVLDFEGEPARSLEERRALQSPLVDVAGMCRSWSYACATAGAPELESPGRQGLIASYMTTVGDAETPLLPTDAEERDRLLSLLELRKSVYELVYELNNRPDWAWIPAGAIPGLLERVAA